MNVKVGDIIRIDNPIGCYFDRASFKEYLADDVPFYGVKENYEEELKGKIGKVLSIVPHSQLKVPVALVFVEELDTLVAVDVEGGYMTMVKQAMPNTVTEDVLKSKIISEQYMRMGVKTTICLLTMANGFEIVGQSACVDPANFDYDLGKKYAYENAFNKLYELEGYLLQSNLK